MKQLTAYLMLIVVCALFFVLPAKAEDAVNFSLNDNKGKEYSLAQLLEQSQFVIIDFWSVDCEPCNQWLPQLQKITDKYKDRGIQFVVISLDSTLKQSKIEPMLRSLKIKAIVLLDPEMEVADLYNANTMPTTMVIDRDMKVRYHHTGYVKGFESEFERELIKILPPVEAKEEPKEEPKEEAKPEASK